MAEGIKNYDFLEPMTPSSFDPELQTNTAQNNDQNEGPAAGAGAAPAGEPPKKKRKENRETKQRNEETRQNKVGKLQQFADELRGKEEGCFAVEMEAKLKGELGLGDDLVDKIMKDCFWPLLDQKLAKCEMKEVKTKK